MDYAQCLCFLGEMYRDLEMPVEAIKALERGIKLHELTSSAAGPRGSEVMASGVSCVG